MDGSPLFPSGLSNSIASLSSLASAARIRQESKEDKELSLTRTTLFTFLVIYNKAGHNRYENYHKGAKALLDWLSPAGCPLDLEEESYSDIRNEKFKVPRMLRGYASHQLVCELEKHTVGYTNRELERAVYLTMTNIVIMECY